MSASISLLVLLLSLRYSSFTLIRPFLLNLSARLTFVTRPSIIVPAGSTSILLTINGFVMLRVKTSFIEEKAEPIGSFSSASIMVPAVSVYIVAVGVCELTELTQQRRQSNSNDLRGDFMVIFKKFIPRFFRRVLNDFVWC